MPDPIASGKAHDCLSPLFSHKCSHPQYLRIFQWPWSQINPGWIKAFSFLHHTIKYKRKKKCLLPNAAPVEFLYAMIMSRKVLASSFFLCTIFPIFILVCGKLPFMFENEFLVFHFHFCYCPILFSSKFNICIILDHRQNFWLSEID